MREYKCSDLSGEVVDLDDPKTYDYLPDEAKELNDLMLREIGYALSYMDYIHTDIFPPNDDQRERVVKLIKAFWKSRRDNWENPMWFKEQIFLFQDETENMC